MFIEADALMAHVKKDDEKGFDIFNLVNFKPRQIEFALNFTFSRTSPHQLRVYVGWQFKSTSN